MSKNKLIVMKFGGTSVGDAERIQNVARIVAKAAQKDRIVVVVSAMSKVTDLLTSAAYSAASKEKAALDQDLEQFETMHTTAITDLKLSDKASAKLRTTAAEHSVSLRSLLESVYALGELTPRAQDLITSFGERLSIHLVANALTNVGTAAQAVEASKLIVTTDVFGDAKPLLDKSTAKTKPTVTKLLDKNIVPVVTGFIGATSNGTITTLGRGGSDYSATILGYCLDADEVWIWTDVDGAMTADPRIVPGATTIPELSYGEAAEMSYFGAKVLHPLTMVPASQKNMPIKVKNTFNPEGAATKISQNAGMAKNGTKAISSMKGLSLITVQGKGMSGVPGVAARVFGAIAAEGINVLFISQASSEYNISLVVTQADGKKAARVLRKAFAPQLAEHTVDTVRLEENLAIVAVVGGGMKGQPGIAGKVFSSLGNANINIVAIAQGSSELNISLVIDETDVVTAVQAIHETFTAKEAAR